VNDEAILFDTASELDEDRATAGAYSNVSTDKLKLLTSTVPGILIVFIISLMVFID